MICQRKKSPLNQQQTHAVQMAPIDMNYEQIMYLSFLCSALIPTVAL